MLPSPLTGPLPRPAPPRPYLLPVVQVDLTGSRSVAGTSLVSLRACAYPKSRTDPLFYLASIRDRGAAGGLCRGEPGRRRPVAHWVRGLCGVRKGREQALTAILCAIVGQARLGSNAVEPARLPDQGGPGRRLPNDTRVAAAHRRPCRLGQLGDAPRR